MYEAELNERGNKIEWPLVLAAIGLMVISVLFINSVFSFRESVLPWYKEHYIKQIIFFSAGIFAVGVIALFDYVTLARWSLVLYWVSILMLLCVEVVGKSGGNARRWIDLGFGFTLQPSEFAKIGFIVAFANFLSRPLEELRRPEVIWIGLGMAALPFLLIAAEPDLGSSMAFLPICLLMMFVAGVPRKFLFKLVGMAGLFAVITVMTAVYAPERFTPFIKGYQRERLYTYFGHGGISKNPTPAEKKDRLDKARNVKEALIAVGSGGLSGQGWRQGIQHSLGFLPRFGAHNDFIFSVIAEEEGFIGSAVILALYTMLLFSGIKIASQARDRLGKLMAVGVVTLLFCHVFINIGMNISLVPVTGIPLPLVSYGGSSVVCSLIAIGILHNVYSYRRSY